LGTLAATGNYRDPAFSSDGRMLAVARATGGVFNLWLIDVAHSTLSRLTVEPVNALFPTWSPNGNALAFTAPSAAGYEPHGKHIGGVSAEERRPRGGHT